MSTALLFWIFNMLADTSGQLSFKAAATDKTDTSATTLGHWKHMLCRPWIWIGVVSYVAEFIAWLCFLSQVELSVGIMLGSFNIVAIMIAGRLIFKERITPWRLAGITLITLGVMVVGLGQ